MLLHCFTFVVHICYHLIQMTLENEVPVSPPVPHTKREAVAPLLPKRHRQFTIKEKMATIRTVQRLMDNGDMT
jgi:hypothetical protein